ncbi:MAG: M1 family aminopeptidase [Phycisphaerales bacterium]|nr:M1 family aminopeptidase [Phycisphaerales bacterium]
MNNHYKGMAPKPFSIMHTRLYANINLNQSVLNGTEWLTLHNNFYTQDSLCLNAKEMTVQSVQLVKADSSLVPLQFQYRDNQAIVYFPKPIDNQNPFTLVISYTKQCIPVKPSEARKHLPEVGLFFMYDAKDSSQVAEAFTQGEPQSNSYWIPTIDEPNQKSTQEFYLTVPKNFQSLSNGFLANQSYPTDSTRTDYWKMDLPNAPYLFFFIVGHFYVYTDTPYNGKPITYWVPDEYASTAKDIFGLTPTMISCYSKLLGIQFPWNKYAQVVGLSIPLFGAMENTTAVLHSDKSLQNKRQLLDDNFWEPVIAHELFHHWFGDLVTCRDWADIMVNESFAAYGEYLWYRYQYGEAVADDQILLKQKEQVARNIRYIDTLELVNHRYKDPSFVFGRNTYCEGPLILHILHTYVGDSAFFASLHDYLQTNAFGFGTATLLKQSFEKVTGMDLDWFWNEWLHRSGHPVLSVRYNYDSAQKLVTMIVEQKGHKKHEEQADYADQDMHKEHHHRHAKPYILPFNIDIYANNKVQRFPIWVNHRRDSFAFQVSSKPDLVNFDADKAVSLLADIKQNKSLSEYVFQYEHAPTFLDKAEAINYCAQMNDPVANQVLTQALQDQSPEIRSFAINHIKDTFLADATNRSVIIEIAKHELVKKIRAEALAILAKNKPNKDLESLFEKAVNDSSYSVAGAGLLGLHAVNPKKAKALVPKLKLDAQGALLRAITMIEALNDREALAKKIIDKKK